jgi:hypothetical protein
MYRLNVMFISLRNIGFEKIYNLLYMTVIQTVCNSFLIQSVIIKLLNVFWNLLLICSLCIIMKFIVYTTRYLMFISYIKRSVAGTVGYMHIVIHHICWNLSHLRTLHNHFRGLFNLPNCSYNKTSMQQPLKFHAHSLKFLWVLAFIQHWWAWSV